MRRKTTITYTLLTIFLSGLAMLFQARVSFSENANDHTTGISSVRNNAAPATNLNLLEANPQVADTDAVSQDEPQPPIPLGHDDENLTTREISHSSPVDLNSYLRADRAAAVDPDQRDDIGEWSTLLDWPIHATHSGLLPNGNIISWHANYVQQATQNGGIFISEPDTLSHTDISFQLAVDTGFFCPGFNLLPDGRFIGVGGSFVRDSRDTIVYDWANDDWERKADSEFVRYYPNMATLPNGEMLLFAGVYAEGQGDSQDTDYPEIYNVENNTWRTLSNAGHEFDHNWYQWVQVAPNGTVFYAGPQQDTYSLDVDGTGTWTKLQARDTFKRTYGSYAIYDAAAGKMLVVGGLGNGAAITNADILDMNTGDRVASNSMTYPRRNGDLTILADGTLFASGGITTNKLTDYDFGVLPGEIWDPETGQWTETDSMVHPRQYHSTALLLPDGRVFKAGGGPCAGLGNCIQEGLDPGDVELFDAEFYSPPYLFNPDGSLADKPEIVTAPDSIENGTTFIVESPDAADIDKMHLIKLGMNTHSQDMAQRLIKLNYSVSGDLMTVSGSSTSNSNVALPGWYMLFLVDENGVPSEGHMINIAGLKELNVLSPGSQSNEVDASVSLQIDVVNPDNLNLNYASATLPSGLSIDSGTGEITGTPDTLVTDQDVTVSVTGGFESDSVTFKWSITPPGNRPPVVTNPESLQHYVGQAVDVQIEADDPDIQFGDELSYAASELPTGLTINAATGRISGTPTMVESKFTSVTVTDSQNESTSANFEWTISGTEVEIDPITTTPELVETAINFSASASGGFNFEYKWRFGDSSAETGYSTNNSISHTYSQPGRYSVTLTVRNSAGNEKSIDFLQLVYGQPTTNPSVWSSTILFEDRSSGTDRVWNVNPDNNTVGVIDVGTNSKVTEVFVGNQPSALALAPDGNVWVTNKESATISIIQPNFKVAETIELPAASKPHGIAFDPAGAAVYVVLEARGELLKLNPATGALIDTLDVGPNPRHISIHGSSGQIYVSRFITPPVEGEGTKTINTTNSGGEILAINPTSFTVEKTILLAYSNVPDSERAGSGLPNYLGPLVISAEGNHGYVPSKQDNIGRGKLRNGEELDHDNTIRSISSYVAFPSEAEDLARRIDHDDAAMPVAATYDRYGLFLFVLMEGSREIRVVDANSGVELSKFSVEFAPQGLVISPDSQTLYVHNFLSRSVSIFDISAFVSETNVSATPIATVSVVANDALPAQILLGKQIFHDGADTRLSPAPYLTCASCHNDGGHDGRTWDFTGLEEGLRNTIALNGRSGTGHGPVHWSGNFDEIHDFENQIRAMQEGEGLMSDTDFAATLAPLGPSKAGLSNDLDALAAYVGSLTRFAPSPYRAETGELTADAQVGKQLFETAGCASCHAGTAYTDSSLNLFHDIGTLNSDSGSRLGSTLTGLDTPTLRDLWDTAPYLHNGSAPTLQDAVLAHNGVMTFSSTELDQLAAYLQQIDGTEAAPAPNQEPAVTNPGNQANQTGKVITLQIEASDGNNNPLTYSAEGLPPGLTMSADGRITGIPTQSGVYQVVVTIRDPYGPVVTSFEWTISGDSVVNLPNKIYLPSIWR